jgi:molecular chaperone GrpE
VTFEGPESEGPIIRDKRRIDPETGEVREPRIDAVPESSSAAGSTGPTRGARRSEGPADEPVAGSSELEVALAERTADLQRLQAEYVNYKRRVDRDREVTRESATAHVLTQLLPVLDDIGRAREHDELTGGFKAVADSLERTVTGLGLVAFGEVGDEFDPRIHEALMHSYSDDVEGPVCQAVLQVGYQLGDRIIRPARVAVAEPPHGAESSDAAATEAGSTTDTDRPSESSGVAGTAGGGQATSPPPYDSHGSDVASDDRGID